MNVASGRVVSLEVDNSLIALAPDDEIALCIDPQGIVKLFESCDTTVKTNWTPEWNTFKTMLRESSYKSIGFRVDVAQPHEDPVALWKGRAVTDWEIILRVRSPTSYDGVVCDLSRMSSVTKKSIDETPPDALKTELARQIEEAHGCRVTDIVLHHDASFDGARWQVQHSTVALNAKHGFFRSRGDNLVNLSLVTSLVERTFVVTTVETCCEAAIRFVNRISSDTKFPYVQHPTYDFSTRARYFILGAFMPVSILSALIWFIVHRTISTKRIRDREL